MNTVMMIVVVVTGSMTRLGIPPSLTCLQDSAGGVSALVLEFARAGASPELPQSCAACSAVCHDPGRQVEGDLRASGAIWWNHQVKLTTDHLA